ncbi:hypothetical protein [Paraburkholderia sp. BCC1884]|uniref:hypothetical protein n=1 Tax=Paraburkholderia sp. BCC1884 TaxID=2562668 RepID=UPI001182C013|nr:hypothetical protein [Paraburkholderia sp. BCC1884]
MASDDLAVLVGVGILALSCLVVCAVYVYLGSERHRNRWRQFEHPKSAAPAIRHIEEPIPVDEVIMGTQLSYRCRTSLYRASVSTARGQSMVFLTADSREDARQRAAAALAAIHGVAAQDVSLCNLASFHELLDVGVSEDEDLRIFEVAWKGADVSAWAEHPLFLTDDASLLGKWAELYADLARELAVGVIERAQGS